ncbi:macrolide transport system ATP-binding/permease protein [Psychromicrobium silvestre]|uniref:Macrolide transport system ATP-binding/permease protein n=1 Tax=Psychromicrobium silvestre TaxID=1645614 RepID=A0A7Y9LTW4_9MICC|nr:ABC-F family ATP-binding cassette domain-containing protein [Psychromicrobium silvestre]NYE95530.1 macrolide transport system ATP-binding/permease protein [Psychromicrobium silvestre]
MTFSAEFPSQTVAPIVLRGVAHGYADRLLFEQVELTISPGEHVVIVGENGAGKSTLLRLMAGVEAPDAGQITFPKRSGYLRQGLEFPLGATVTEVIDDALAEPRAMEAELLELSSQLVEASPEQLSRYDQLATAFALRDGYQAEAWLDAAMDRLGLGQLDRQRSVDALSGGERERLALACLLADPAPVLLLDEPTNHLDAAGLDWLENNLAAHRGSVVVVSHDRMLLRRVAHTIIEVDAERSAVRRYGNGYSGYLREKQAEHARWEQSYQQWQDAMARERQKAVAGTGRNGYGRVRDHDRMAFDFKAGTVDEAVRSQIRNAQERLRRLEENPVERPPQPLRLSARLGVPRSSGVVLEGHDLLLPARLNVPSFTLDATERVLLSGPNGAGKTSLLEALSGRVVTAGELRRRAPLGYLPQEVPFPAQPEMRLLPAFAAGRIGDIERQAEELLTLGLFRSADFLLPVGTLSAGQHRRLALARLLLGDFEVLLVDEPSNHLAPQLVEELQELFAGFSGALLLVSHDRVFHEWFSGLSSAREMRMENGRLLESSS